MVFIYIFFNRKDVFMLFTLRQPTAFLPAAAFAVDVCGAAGGRGRLSDEKVFPSIAVFCN